MSIRHKPLSPNHFNFFTPYSFIFLLMYRASFNNRQQSFYATLKQEVDNYFTQNNLKPTGNGLLYFKTFLFLSLGIYLYVQLVFFTPPVWIALPLCVLLGFDMAFIGFNIMHDGCHGSYSSKKWVNELMGYSLNLLGSNSLLWKFKHNVAHHTFTNIDGHDADIVQGALLRLAPSQPLRPVHKFQHLYAIFLYGLISFAWIFAADFEKYFEKKVLSTSIQGFTLKDHIIFWVTKVFYVFAYIILPIYMLGFVPFIIGFLAVNLSLGVMMAIVFQLAHIVEIAEFEDATHANLKIEKEWAVHQLDTTVNFATHNRFLSFFLGGLNFQVEHHLFPKISHVHYPAIQKIVRETCEKYGVEYKSYPTMRAAVASHFRLMWKLGHGLAA